MLWACRERFRPVVQRHPRVERFDGAGAADDAQRVDVAAALDEDGRVQVVDDELPETEHDFSVDLIVTPDDMIRCTPPRRPSGIVLSHLTSAKTASMRSWRTPASRC